MGIGEAYCGPSGKLLPNPMRSVDEIVEKLRAFFAEEQPVVLAYLFGSYARGEMNEFSDLDLAVFLEQGMVGEELYETYRKLFLGVRKILGTERFDLVLLNRAPLPLKFEVVSKGRLVYARDEEAVNCFEIDVIRKYQDTAYLRKVQNEYLRERARQWYSKKRASTPG